MVSTIHNSAITARTFGATVQARRDSVLSRCFAVSSASSPKERGMTVAQDFEEFFGSCNKCDVEYVVVGGYAFAFHAHPRYTGDMDVFVRPSEENAQRVMGALRDFGFALSSLTWRDFAAAGHVVQLGYPPLRIDILTSIDGVSFDEAWSRRVATHYGEQHIWLLSKEDLIRNKRASGRKQDLLDLESLT